MYIRFLLGCLMAAVVLLSSQPAGVFAQKKADKDEGGPKIDQGTPKEYAQLLQQKEVVGKLSSVTGKSLIFDIEYLPGGAKAILGQAQDQQEYLQQLARLTLQREQAMLIKDAKKRGQRLRQINDDWQRLQQNLKSQKAAKPDVNRAYKEFEVDLPDNLVVRRNFIPWEYDDKGYPKTYTQAEIAAMRGKDSSKPGYAATFEDLAGGQMIKLYLASSTAKPEPSKEAKKDVKPEAKKPAATDDGTRLVANMILILAEAPDRPLPKKDMPKKK